MNTINNKQCLVALFLMAFSWQALAIIWVGGDNNCHHQSIQAALDEVALGNDTTIWIASNIAGGVYTENLNLDYTLPVTIGISGGFDSCGGSLTQTPTVINGGNNGPVFNITGGNLSQTVGVNLNLLSLQSGVSDGSGRAGGLNISSVNTNVFLTQMSINNNTGVNGGGLHIDLQDNSRYQISSTLIFNNTATNGGGVYCAGSGRSVIFQSDNSVAFNQALSANAGDGHGGGIYITDDCPMFFSSGDTLFGSVEGIVGNQASNHGGGAYLNNRALLRLSASAVSNGPIAIATVKENIADADNSGLGDGGAIYLTGDDTQLSLQAALLEDNVAVNGGALAVTDQARISYFGSTLPCLFNGHCTQISNNTAGANVAGINLGVGGAVYANNGGDAFFTRTLFTDNQADLGVVASVSDQARVTLIASNINNNGAQPSNDLSQNYLFSSVSSGSRLTLSQVTVADNTINSGSSVFFAGLGANVTSENSILRGQNDNMMETLDVNGSQVTLSFTCNLVSEVDSLGTSAGIVDNVTATFDSEYNFVNRLNGDYRIQTPSLAIDMCDAASFNWPDFEGQAFGFNDPTVSGTLLGSHDAGADESYLSDIFFADGFEGSN